MPLRLRRLLPVLGKQTLHRKPVISSRCVVTVGIKLERPVNLKMDTSLIMISSLLCCVLLRNPHNKRCECSLLKKKKKRQQVCVCVCVQRRSGHSGRKWPGVEPSSSVKVEGLAIILDPFCSSVYTKSHRNSRSSHFCGC